MSGTNKQGENYVGDSDFGVDKLARTNGGVSTSSTGLTHAPKNHSVTFKAHPANKKLNGKPMAK